ncbi:cupin domain-containing protein [Candidatus Sumerlaeota bacterium]|nr:cupin domain-containing protein [Candidatus Sumerlaeota bacterium]
MPTAPIRKTIFFMLCPTIMAAVLTSLAGVVIISGPPQPQESLIVRQDETKITKGDWGQMYHYFAGESLATRNVLVAVAVVQPGKAVHRAHRHSQEEYLMLIAGSGVWSLDGKETVAKTGDVLYAAPWVYHGLTNTGAQPLKFAVVRYDGKGVELPPRPDKRPDEL